MNDRPVLRGFIANVEVLPPLIVTFQFNPKQVTDNREVRFGGMGNERSGPLPGTQYIGPGGRTITFRIELDGLEQGTNAINPLPLDNGVSTELAKLRSFLYPKADAWAMVSSLFGGDDEGVRMEAPPRCYFGFGLKILECVVTRMNVVETQFNSFLAPVRATVDLTLTVLEQECSDLYEFDKQHRNILAALGLQNVRVF
jgi:hypothetical protein